MLDKLSKSLGKITSKLCQD